MPIYEYRCKKCNHIFDAIQHFGAPPPAKCERCGASSANLVKLISPAHVVFKGSGFYLTDNRGAKNGSLANPSTGEATSDKAVAIADKSGEATKRASNASKDSGTGTKDNAE